MDRMTRICIWTILLGLANFLLFTVVYIIIGGEALTGTVIQNSAGEVTYMLRGDPAELRAVSRGVFLYSGVHSISIWPTVGAVMLAMLTLAKERFVLSLRSSVVRGRTLLTVLATIIALMTAFITIHFICSFVEVLKHPQVTSAILDFAGYAGCA